MSDIVDINTLFGPAPIAASDLSVDDLSALMARHSVGACCTLSTLGILLDPGAGNTATRAAAAENPRLVPVATYNPLTCHGHDGAQIHPRADGFRMVRFFPALQGWPPRFAPLLAILRRLEPEGIPVMIDIDQPGEATELVAALGPDHVPVVLAGIGERTLSEAIALLQVHDGLYIETSRLLMMGGAALAVERAGADRVLFGSGAPMRPMAAALASLRLAEISEQDRALVMGGNARRLLNL
jgi:hypothetical protein